MFKTRDFLPVAITVLVVFGLCVLALAQSGACNDDWTCWIVDPIEIILSGRIPQPANPSYLLIILTTVGAKAILLVGAFLSGVRIVVTAIRHDFRAALARRMKNHTIVCGLGETGMQIVRGMRAAGQSVVVIDRTENAADVAACDQLGIVVIKGDASSADVLRLAGIRNASTVIASTGDDASNIDVALRVKELAASGRSGTTSATTVLAEMRNRWLFSRLENHDRRPLGSSQVELRLFNNYENAARLLLNALRLPPGPEIECGAFVIFGFGDLGRHVMLHVLRAVLANVGTKARIVVFEKDAANCEKLFAQTYAAAARLADVSFAEAPSSPDSREEWNKVKEHLQTLPLLGAAICFEDDQVNLGSALSLRRQLDDALRIHVPVLLRLGKYRHLGQFVGSMESLDGQAPRLQIFGTLDELLGFDILIRDDLDSLARVMHRRYRESHPSGDRPANQPWSLLPETLKMSNRRRADNLPILLAQAGLQMVPADNPQLITLTSDEIELLSGLEHRRWTIERQLLGYSYGAVRSEFPPRHDLLVDWQQLPAQEQERGRRDFGTIPATLAEVKFEVQRQHKVLAIGDALPVALAELAAADKSLRAVVIADVDTPDGRAAAQRALDLPDATLWLVSSHYPAGFPDLPAIGTVFQKAAGWVTRDQFHARS